MDDIITLMKKDTFAQLLGIEILEVSPGCTKVHMKVTKDHLNSPGMVHGGVIYSIADYAFAIACNSHGILSVAANCTINYLRPAKGATLTAEASEISVSRKLGTYQVKVTDGEGNLCALFTGLAYRKGQQG
jgi:acyl-CoA thioesterase